MDIAKEIATYVDDVLSGKQIAGELQRMAVQRYVDDLARANRAGSRWPYYFDETIAEASVEFFPALLTHTTGEWMGQPFALEPQGAFIVWNLQGWRRRDGSRRFRSAHLEFSRKSGKTTKAAGLCWLCFTLDREARAEVYNCATKRKQSLRCFDEVVRMRERQPAFADITTIKASEYRITKDDHGTIEALGCDGGGSDGLNPHLVIFDELHEWKSRAHRALWAKLRTGSALRKQPLFVTITTAGDDQSALWIEERAFAAKVLRGEAVADHVFAFIFCLDDDDDIFDEAAWVKANPLIGQSGFESVLAEYRQMAGEAVHNPISKRDFERYYCNRRVESVNRAFSDSIWRKGRTAPPVLSGRLCHLGCDLGWRDDIAALGACFPPRGDGDPYVVKAVGFLPADCNRDLTEPPFPALIEAGKLIITPGNTTDTNAIHSQIAAWRGAFNVRSIAVDPNNAREFGTQCVSNGLKTYEFQQSCRNYNEPMREFMKLLADGRVTHGDCPLLNWCQQNMMSFANAAGLIMPSKTSSLEKIDPLVAVIMAFAEALFFASRKDSSAGRAQIRFL